MKTGLVGFLLGFAVAWALHEWAYRRWRRRVVDRANEALDTAEARLEDQRQQSPVCQDGHDPVKHQCATVCGRCGLVLELLPERDALYELRPPIAYTEGHIEVMLRLWRGLPDCEVPPAEIDDLVALGFAKWDEVGSWRLIPKITGAGIDQLIRRGLRK